MMCLIAWSKRMFLPGRDYVSLSSKCIRGALKSCLKRAAPRGRPFVVQKNCTGAGIDLRHLGSHSCCFHSSLQNTMKWTIESRGAAFSSACFLERAVFSFCFWKQNKTQNKKKAGEHAMTQRESGHFPIVFRIKSSRAHLFSAPTQSVLTLCCTVVFWCWSIGNHPSLYPSIHPFTRIPQLFGWPNNHKRTLL